MSEENDESPEGACCECLGASDPATCKAFFKAMLDAAMGPYAPAIDLVVAIKDPTKIGDLPAIAAEIPTTAADIFGWSPDLPPVSLSIPGVGDVDLPGADIPGWSPDLSLPMAAFLTGSVMIPIQPVLDLALDPMGAFPPDLPTLEGLTAQIPLPPPPPEPPIPPSPNPACIAELLMFPVTMLQDAIDGGGSEEEDDEEDSEE